MAIYRNRNTSKANMANVTDLKIGKEVTKENPKNEYRFEIHTYFGDADAYETVNIKIKSKEQAVEFADFLKNQMAVAYPHGRGGGDEYLYKNSKDVPDWNKWFGYDEETNEYGVFGDYWPCNWDYWGEASYDYTHITYYDEDGREYSVEEVSE